LLLLLSLFKNKESVTHTPKLIDIPFRTFGLKLGQ